MMHTSNDSEEDSIVAEINITPLTDIFLVLLIIFMISSSAMLEGGLNVKLPTAKGANLTHGKGSRPVYVTLTRTGEVQVNSLVTAFDHLTETLKSELAKTTEKTVVIRGDEGINLGKAVKVMDAAKAVGAEKIALATQPPK